jgi:prepilin-type N-terminal cleavage/methylation domain-containing protein
MHATPRPGPRGFTLVEILVVLAIIALITAVALPTILSGLNERRVSESARVLQAILAGTRDIAIRSNAPRGIRLLPDPVFNGQNGNPLASNRVIPIEPGPDYTEGLVSAVVASNNLDPFYSGLLTLNAIANNGTAIGGLPGGTYLLLAESDFSGTASNLIPNNPTTWSQNVRQGDKIRFNDSGAYYTIAGPVNGPPYGITKASFGTGTPNPYSYNSERVISCSPNSPGIPLASSAGWTPEFLILMNGQDDNGNGWIDEGCDGIDNDGDGIIDPGFNGLDDSGFINGVAYPKNNIIDEPAEMMIGNGNAGEFEQEVFVGSQASTPPFNQSYTISRRPVVSPNARETTLPAGVVIDLTTWDESSLSTSTVLLPERSRLPVDAATFYVDIMIDQTGRVVTPGAGSDGGGTYKNSPLSSLPFYHFWLTEREGVQPLPNPLPSPPAFPLLPLPKGTPGYNSTVFLTGERRLVTLFVKTGQIVSNSIQNFSATDVNFPFYDAQSGIKEPL